MMRIQKGNHAEEKKTKLNKSFLLLVVLATLGLTGCSDSSIGLDEQVAGQIGMDAAGVSKEDASDLHVEALDSDYLVTFKGEKGCYQIQVDSNGHIISYLFEKEDRKSADGNTAEETNSGTAQNQTPASSSQNATESNADSGIQYTENKEKLSNDKLMQLAAQQLNLTQWAPSDFSVAEIGNGQTQLSVEIVGSGTFIIVFDSYSGEIIRSSNQ